MATPSGSKWKLETKISLNGGPHSSSFSQIRYVSVKVKSAYFHCLKSVFVFCKKKRSLLSVNVQYRVVRKSVNLAKFLIKCGPIFIHITIIEKHAHMLNIHKPGDVQSGLFDLHNSGKGYKVISKWFGIYQFRQAVDRDVMTV